MKHPVTSQQARISEIFSSLQGEGPHAGEKHIFVRFEECHIHCVYCDELDKVGEVKTIDDVCDEIKQLEKQEGPHSYISFTGGEPLIYLPFLKPLMRQLAADGFKNYLETDGILWRSLEDVLEFCDCIAMDMKPPSVTKERDFSTEHKKFLQVAKQYNVFVKLVISKELELKEFDDLMDIVYDVAPETPVILQPVSAQVEGHEDAELMQLLYTLQQRAQQRGLLIRVMPRLHKILNIR